MSARDYLLINKFMFRDITESIVEILGQEGATVIFFIGVNSGRRSARRRLKESRGDKMGALQRLTELKRDQNWAAMTFQNIDLKRHTGKICVKNCLCTQDEPYQCYFLKGFLTGSISEIFGRKISISHISSDRPLNGSCELLFGPPDLESDR